MRQAVILAGGRATRMLPHSLDRPKAMVEVSGTPIIGHQLEWLARNEVTDVIVSVGYRAGVIQEHLGHSSYAVAAHLQPRRPAHQREGADRLDEALRW